MTYQDLPDPLLNDMEPTELTTVLDSRLPAQRDPEAAVTALRVLLAAHSPDAMFAAAESSRRYRAGMDTGVRVEAERRWREQA